MEPIINPWVFYFIEVADALNTAFELMTALLIAICVLHTFSIIDKSDKTQYLKFLKTMLKIIVPCATLTIFTPSSDTIYKMIIADNVTPHNIEVVGDTIEGGIDYIFEKINALTLDEMEDAEND